MVKELALSLICNPTITPTINEETLLCRNILVSFLMFLLLVLFFFQENEVLRKQNIQLSEENGKLVGHKNHKQRIEYLVKLKKDNTRLQEVTNILCISGVLFEANMFITLLLFINFSRKMKSCEQRFHWCETTQRIHSWKWFWDLAEIFPSQQMALNSVKGFYSTVKTW